MATKIFLNIPIKSLKNSMAFFGALGFEFNLQYTDETGTCMIVSDTIFIMLLEEERFKSFTKKAIADTAVSNEAIIGISTESKENVDAFIEKVVANGGKTVGEPYDHGFMYGRSFTDIDGHLWEIFWMAENN